MNIIKQAGVILICLLSVQARAVLADSGDEINHLQQRWEEVNYQLEGKTRLSAFKQLVEEADMATAEYPDKVEVWIWSGIIKSTYAGAKGGLGALKLAKQSRADLEKAIAIDGDAMQGSAYTSLGTLYYSVPGWPVGFGDDAKAEELLRKALALNPDGIDSNYFYGTFLIDQKRYQEARTYLQRAQQAPPRPRREIADAGRRQEIARALEDIIGK